MGTSIRADKHSCGTVGKSVIADASCTEVPDIGWNSVVHIGDCQGVVFGRGEALGLCQSQGWVADELVHLCANTDDFVSSSKKRQEKERKGKERKGKERKGKERKEQNRKGKERTEQRRKEKFGLFGDHDRSLSQQQPRAMTIDPSPSCKP